MGLGLSFGFCVTDGGGKTESTERCTNKLLVLDISWNMLTEDVKKMKIHISVVPVQAQVPVFPAQVCTDFVSLLKSDLSWTNSAAAAELLFFFQETAIEFLETFQNA